MYRILLLNPAFRMALLRQHTYQREIGSFAYLRRKLKIGDWFLLCQLGRNLDRLQFSRIVKVLQEKMKIDEIEQKGTTEL
jgi:hypothetical protein